MDARCEPGGRVFRAIKPRIGNRCAASGDLYIRISGISRVFFHIVSVNFYASVLIFTVLTAGG